MQIKLNKAASVLIYTIVLTTISLILATILLSNKISLYNNQIFYKLNSRFFNQIKSNNMINFDNMKKINPTLDIFEISNTWARSQIVWIVIPNQQKNIFWNNKKIEDFIDENPNNDDGINKKISLISDWNLFLDVSSDSKITFIEYEKDRFDNFWEIKEIKSFTGLVNWSGFIENNNWNLYLTWELDSNTISFDFSSKGYFLFLTNTGSDLITYSLSGFENTGSWIYLNPINDDNSNTWSIEFLGYDVILRNNWNIIWKMLKKVFEK